MKLGDDRGIPLNELGQTSVNVHLDGVDLDSEDRIPGLEREHLKVDALAGIRYWYVGQELSPWNLWAWSLTVGQLGRRSGRRQVHPAA